MEEKKDRLQVLKVRIETEGLDGDLSRVGDKLGVPASTVKRVLEKDFYHNLTTVKQRDVVTAYLRMLNDRKMEEARLDAELLNK